MNSRRLLAVVIVASLAAGAWGLVRYFTADREVVLTDLDTPIRAAEPPRPANPDQFADATVGGTYAGVVVDDRDRPVADADVLVVAVDSDAKVVMETVDADNVGDRIELPVFGDYRTAARGRTDAQGRFHLAVGDARVVALVAWSREFAPGMVAHTKDTPLRPGTGHVVRIARAGWLKGRIVDQETGLAVGGAEVIVYLQHRANQGDRPGPEPVTATNAFSIFQRYVGHVLGPMVWGLEPPPGDTGFHLKASPDGWFTFGPLMKEVQIEVVITHPEYMWTDNDPDKRFEADQGGTLGRKDVARKVRTVVMPGETKEVTYYLVKGKEVSGTVVDAAGKPIDGVEIALEHVAQYSQHWRYRTHARTGRTDAKGRFRIAGLSFEPYNLRFTHPTFDTEYFSGVKAGSDETYKVQSAGGWLDLTVVGGPEENGQKKPWSGRVIVEPREAAGTRKQEAAMIRDGKVVVERLRPGHYDVTVVSGTQISDPARVEVKSGEATKASVTMQAGGGIRLAIRDAAGKVVDPAEVHLYVETVDKTADGKETTAMRRVAVIVAREGQATTDGLLAGHYTAEVSALGFVATEVPAFDVAPGRPTLLPPVVLRRQSYLKLTGIVGEDGRGVTVDTVLYVGEDGAEPTRRRTQDAGLLPVRPGSVILRAETADGRRSEQTLDVPDGATVPVEVRVTK
ncbi:MAG: carboxypeptidase-like regulatory domain-containing protein [Planctomycetota bacterium]